MPDETRDFHAAPARPPLSGKASDIAARAFGPASTAVAEGRIPAAVLGVVNASGDRAALASGTARLGQEALVTCNTWFDLASLTKIVFTTAAVLDLVATGRVRLDTPLSDAIPDLRQYDPTAPERQLTFHQCLTHQTHLPAVEPLYTYGHDPRTLRAFILQREWQAGPPVYSDIGFMLLGIAIERLTGAALGVHPLPAGLGFRPPPALCAATECCQWRGRVMQGEVHDENAYALGGPAGHAGLFGTVDGVLDFALGVLGAPRDHPVRVRHGATHRTVGWEAAHAGWSGGDRASEQAIGHTGFTGTGLWIDFERKLAWTLLTNRVHPSRFLPTGIAALRRDTGDLVCA